MQLLERQTIASLMPQRAAASVMLCLLLCVTTVCYGAVFLKVNGVKMPKSSCLLGTREGTQFGRPIMCALVCARNPICNSYCVKQDGLCDVYEARLATFYELAYAGEHTLYDACYSSWVKSQFSILNPNLTVILHPSTSAPDINRPIDGYFCSTYNRYLEVRPTSVDGDNPYYVIDFGATQSVTRIISVISGTGTLKDIVVTLGNSESYLTNLEIASRAGGPTGEMNEEEDIALSQTISGRYLTFYRVGSAVSVVISDLLVFP